MRLLYIRKTTPAFPTGRPARATAEGGRVPTFLLANLKENIAEYSRIIEASALKDGQTKKLSLDLDRAYHCEKKGIKTIRGNFFVSIGSKWVSRRSLSDS